MGCVLAPRSSNCHESAEETALAKFLIVSQTLTGSSFVDVQTIQFIYSNTLLDNASQPSGVGLHGYCTLYHICSSG